MVELWRQMLDLSIELNKFDDAGHCRGGRDIAPPRGVSQRAIRSAPQTRHAIEYRSDLARILEAIPIPHQEYLPSKSSWPTRQNQYDGRTYVRQPTQIDALPVVQDRRPQPIRTRRTAIHARKTNEWRYYAVASFFGAVVGITGYVLLFQGGAGKGEAVQALKYTSEITMPAERGRESNRAFFEPAPNEQFHEDAPPPQVVYATMAQREGSQGAFDRTKIYDRNSIALRQAQELKPEPSLARKGTQKEKAAKPGGSETPQGRKTLSKTRSSGSEVLRQ
jgi:hypothetical protein